MILLKLLKHKKKKKKKKKVLSIITYNHCLTRNRIIHPKLEVLQRIIRKFLQQWHCICLFSFRPLHNLVRLSCSRIQHICIFFNSRLSPLHISKIDSSLLLQLVVEIDSNFAIWILDLIMKSSIAQLP
ncbi:hypothetical protein HanIR_Chr14g0718311 [Helianthus annuus]|nr:hypothetical protein HanIR_Chr14g0718311 [Helianthus annuus]